MSLISAPTKSALGGGRGPQAPVLPWPARRHALPWLCSCRPSRAQNPRLEARPPGQRCHPGRPAEAGAPGGGSQFGVGRRLSSRRRFGCSGASVDYKQLGPSAAPAPGLTGPRGRANSSRLLLPQALQWPGFPTRGRPALDRQRVKERTREERKRRETGEQRREKRGREREGERTGGREQREERKKTEKERQKCRCR